MPCKCVPHRMRKLHHVVTAYSAEAAVEAGLGAVSGLLPLDSPSTVTTGLPLDPRPAQLSPAVFRHAVKSKSANHRSRLVVSRRPPSSALLAARVVRTRLPLPPAESKLLARRRLASRCRSYAAIERTYGARSVVTMEKVRSNVDEMRPDMVGPMLAGGSARGSKTKNEGRVSG